MYKNVHTVITICITIFKWCYLIRYLTIYLTLFFKIIFYFSYMSNIAEKNQTLPHTHRMIGK